MGVAPSGYARPQLSRRSDSRNTRRYQPVVAGDRRADHMVAGRWLLPGRRARDRPAASYGLGLASALLLFASILAHEFGHALVARRHGVVIEEIDLWLLGGVARMSGQPQNPRDELDFALAGPVVTAVIAAIFGALALAHPTSAPAALLAVIRYQAEVNVLILGFNLLPAFPLDGGRVARALLWRRSGNIAAATDTAAGLGRAFGYVLIGGGVLMTFYGYLEGLWLAVIGVFLTAAASAERIQQEVVSAFTGIHAEELMSQPVICIPADLTLTDAAEQYFSRYRCTAFPVIDASGRAVGLLSISQLEHIPHRANAGTLVGNGADRDLALMVDKHEDVAHLLERSAFARVGRATVIDESRRPVGILSITDVQRAITATRLRDTPSRPARPAPH